LSQSSTTIETKFDSSPNAKRQRLEAVLFLARQPLTTRRISQLAILEDGTEARVMIKALNEHYDQVGRSFHIKRVAGGYQLLTRPQFFDWINRIKKAAPMIRLSQSAQETLTVIAYRQPIMKADIETVRGVGCGEMLRQLLEKGMVKIAGRSEELGRPFLYATTRQFLTEFGFGNIEQLPQYESLGDPGLPNWNAEDDEVEEAVPDDEDDEDEEDDEEWDEDDEDFDDQ
jgi:segregation and condensation protein B